MPVCDAICHNIEIAYAIYYSTYTAYALCMLPCSYKHHTATCKEQHARFHCTVPGQEKGQDCGEEKLSTFFVNVEQNLIAYTHCAQLQEVPLQMLFVHVMSLIPDMPQ